MFVFVFTGMTSVTVCHLRLPPRLKRVLTPSVLLRGVKLLNPTFRDYLSDPSSVTLEYGTVFCLLRGVK